MAKLQVNPPGLCEVPDERCQRPISPNFLPGISLRHTPTCTDNICGVVLQCDMGNWRVTNQNTLDRSKWIEGWVMTQLLTRAYVDCPEHPLGQRGGGWWADAFRDVGARSTRPFMSGSKLWALKYRHGGATNDLLMMAKMYATQALTPLLGWGIASRINVDAQYIARGNIPFPGAALHLHISIRGPGVSSDYTLEGSQQPSAEWLWREYMPPAAIGKNPGRHHERVAL